MFCKHRFRQYIKHKFSWKHAYFPWAKNLRKWISASHPSLLCITKSYDVHTFLYTENVTSFQALFLVITTALLTIDTLLQPLVSIPYYLLLMPLGEVKSRKQIIHILPTRSGFYQYYGLVTQNKRF